MLLSILHRTTFRYAGKAHESFNEARLRPLDDDTQQCHQFSFRVSPAALPREFDDFYGNKVQYFEVIPAHARLIVEATSVVETKPMDERPRIASVSHEQLQASSEREMLAEFYTESQYVPLGDELSDEADVALAGGRSDVWGDVRRLASHIHRTVTYRPRATGVDTLATDVLEIRMGVCQDFAHLHLGLCRSLGIPARYVSGYFFNNALRPREVEASHAWTEAWIPGHGWAAFDPTHDRVADDRYVRLAIGRDYADIRPVNGTYRGAPTRSMKVDVAVRQAPSLATAAP
jgi:transglutaminase-like putative cysteine protease